MTRTWQSVVGNTLLAVMIVGILTASAEAQVRQSSNYQVQSDSINVGGGLSTSANYRQESTVGEITTGRSGSSNYLLAVAGYQQGVTTTDTATPTVPTTIAVTPVSSDQINVTWDVSTDNVAVGGYVVRRDTVPIATTSLTTYSDTGLNASTTYSYTITAFDTSSNYSSISTAAATTTLPIPPNTSSGTTGSRSTDASAGLELRNVVIVEGHTTAQVSFDTSVLTEATISWGRTSNYEKGYIDSDVFKNEHQTVITGLLPGIVYELEIFVQNNSGDESYTQRIQFTTLADSDTQAPANATSFTGSHQAENVVLAWTNPTESDFAKVKIVSSDTFYPQNTTNGWFVYEGAGTNFLDTRPHTEGRRYYTLFTYDLAGNISSGAVMYVDAPGFILPTVPIEDLQEVSTSTATSTEFTVTDGVPVGGATIDFFDFYFEQNGVKKTGQQDTVVLELEEETLIFVPYEYFDENLKTIIVHIAHSEDTTRRFSFMLRINQDKTAYEARIGSLPRSGTYSTTFEVYDYKTQRVTHAAGTVLVRGTSDYSQKQSLIRIPACYDGWVPPPFLFTFWLFIYFL